MRYSAKLFVTLDACHMWHNTREWIIVIVLVFNNNAVFIEVLLYLADWFRKLAPLSQPIILFNHSSLLAAAIFSHETRLNLKARAITLCFLALYQATASFREWHGCFNRWKGMAIFYVNPCWFILTLFFGKTDMREGYVRLLTRSSTLCSTYHNRLIINWWLLMLFYFFFLRDFHSFSMPSKTVLTSATQPTWFLVCADTTSS